MIKLSSPQTGVFVEEIISRGPEVGGKFYGMLGPTLVFGPPMAKPPNKVGPKTIYKEDYKFTYRGA